MATKPVLYSYFRSSASWRVRIVLALKGIDYEYKSVNLVKDGGQQNTEEYKAINPMGQVPAFVIGDTALTQSLAIIDYLEDTHPEPSITPKDPIKKAKARALAEVICSGTQPMTNASVSNVLFKGDLDKRPEWSRQWIEKGFTAYEKMVQETVGKYSVGDDITIADICLVPQLYNAKRFKVDLSKFPTVMKIVDTCSQHPAFKAADPSAQPDCPEDLKK
ncbi:Glutathione S-transferase zeta-1 [Mactra antiquata]